MIALAPPARGQLSARQSDGGEGNGRFYRCPTCSLAFLINSLHLSFISDVIPFLYPLPPASSLDTRCASWTCFSLPWQFTLRDSTVLPPTVGGTHYLPCFRHLINLSNVRMMDKHFITLRMLQPAHNAVSIDDPFSTNDLQVIRRQPRIGEISLAITRMNRQRMLGTGL